VSGADQVALGSGAEKQISHSSSIGSEAPTMDVSLCSKKLTTAASNCSGGGGERLGGGEGVGPVAAPSREITSSLGVSLSMEVVVLELRGMPAEKTSWRRRTSRRGERTTPIAIVSVDGLRGRLQSLAMW
jgi:hypothetical protein